MLAALLATLTTLQPPAMSQQPPNTLQAIAAQAFADAQNRFPEDRLLPEDVAITIALVNRPANAYALGSFRGDDPMYPASVVKLFFLAYAAHQLDTAAITLTPELQRAASDMIKASSNDATGYIVDLTCGTTPGPELSESQLADFGHRRQAPNRWFQSLGYTHVNAVQRTYNEGPYGRERQWVGTNYENRNKLTTEATAMLMADVALGKHWSAAQTAWMHSLLRRATPADDDNADPQAKAYIGRVAPAGSTIHTKAGWTSEVRHDVAWLRHPDGRELVLAIYTKKARNGLLVPYLAHQILQSLRWNPAPLKATSESLLALTD